ncbi:MAG: hybrid sensor histidine kinase/response regulator [Hyphomicrobiales bacterium]
MHAGAAISEHLPEDAGQDNTLSCILVADDDPIIRELAASNLACENYTILDAANGAEAWERLRARHFDLALVDLDMPEVDGFELIMRIRADPDMMHLPVIVITSRDDIIAIERAFGAGATAFITKPVNWPVLRHQVHYVLRASRTSEALRAAKDEVEAASRLKDNFLAVMSHELRTPLNLIIGFAEVLDMQTEGPIGNETYVSYIDEIVHGGRRLLGTVTEMTLFSRCLSDDLELEEGEYPLSSLVEEATQTIAPIAQKRGVAVDISGVPMNRQVCCDLKLLGRCLIGLLDNATKFSKGGDTVRLEAEVGADGGLRLSVIDRGQGMTPDQVAHCHEPFVQADMSFKRSAEGVGLGLAVARALVELHDGTMHLHSTPGEGTTAELHLPAARVLACQIRNIEPIAVNSQARSRNIRPASSRPGAGHPRPLSVITGLDPLPSGSVAGVVSKGPRTTLPSFPRKRESNGRCRV